MDQVAIAGPGCEPCKFYESIAKECAECIEVNTTWHTPGGEDGLTKAQLYTHRKAQNRIPKPKLRVECLQFVEWFWDARAFCGNYENVLTPSILAQWQSHSYVELERWERDVLFGMDRAFRHAYSGVLQYHMRRDQIKDDKDKARFKK